MGMQINITIYFQTPCDETQMMLNVSCLTNPPEHLDISFFWHYPTCPLQLIGNVTCLARDTPDSSRGKHGNGDNIFDTYRLDASRWRTGAKLCNIIGLYLMLIGL